MYEAFYGLNGKPFQLNPDPEFFFASRGHARAYAYLQYGLYQSEGFIVVTGEVGAGKTTLVRSLLKRLDPSKVVAAQISRSALTTSTHRPGRFHPIPSFAVLMNFLLPAASLFGPALIIWASPLPSAAIRGFRSFSLTRRCRPR